MLYLNKNTSLEVNSLQLPLSKPCNDCKQITDNFVHFINTVFKVKTASKGKEMIKGVEIEGIANMHAVAINLNKRKKSGSPVNISPRRIVWHDSNVEKMAPWRNWNDTL